MNQIVEYTTYINALENCFLLEHMMAQFIIQGLVH